MEFAEVHPTHPGRIPQHLMVLSLRIAQVRVSPAAMAL